MTTWTDEKVALLRRLKDEGRNRSQIAAAIGGGCTVLSVASKLKRIDIVREPDTEFWTDEKVELFRKLWPTGMSCSKIAAALGCTKNTIVGKRKRLKLPKRQIVACGRKLRAPRTPVQARRKFNGLKPMPIIVTNPEPIAVPIECVGVSLLDLNQGMCKWLIDDDRYCGNPAPRRAPYCAGHKVLSYQPRSALRPLAGLVALT